MDAGCCQAGNRRVDDMVNLNYSNSYKSKPLTPHLQKSSRSGNSDYSLSFNVGNLALDFVKVGLGKDFARVY